MVFDASALIAWLKGEPGAALVEELLDDADVPRYVHAVNLLEAFVYFARNSDVLTARQAIADMRAVGLEERTDLDTAFCEDVAALKADHHVALGDCCGLALARRMNAVVTADRGELRTPKDANVCSITFIR